MAIPNPDQGADNTTFDKASRDALSAVAIMYRECHAEAPGSPLCGALQDIQEALSAVHAQKMSGVAQVQPPATIGEATEQLHAETMAGAPGGAY